MRLRGSPTARTLLGRLLLAALTLAALRLAAAADSSAAFNTRWRFLRSDPPGAEAADYHDQGWEPVTLPHTPRLEALVTGQSARQWQGICWYRKSFTLPETARDKTVLFRLEGAMNKAELWVNGRSAGRFQGGYLPYVADISSFVRAGHPNVIAVRLDNRDNPITGPKPLVDLDFNLYGGLYRDASLVLRDRLHITDPVLADTVAGGGVFVTYPAVSRDEATVRVQTQVENADRVPRSFLLRTTLLDAGGQPMAAAASGPFELAPGARREWVQEIQLASPQLWSPRSPTLYQLRSELTDGGRTIDARQTRIGIRRVEITADGFRINGQKMFLRGVNRHQEYPYLGNAVPDEAQYRDARKIKEAGFDYVRLSHYPQSPAFLDACDELGLVVMDSVLGWQYFNKDPAFAEQKFKECRQLIRRDRNHPCVVLWEVSLNESSMPRAFVARANAIAHQEYPGDQCYTCGWVEGYDVFLQARQHGGCRAVTNRPCLISEYGDWEYYAQNAGLAQEQWKDLRPAERSSRQLRGDGEVRMLQQALNFQEAHNDDLSTRAFGDGLWVMFDYNRGYAPDVESSGVMDLFRLPKFSYWFYRSQRDADDRVAGALAGPIVFIANYWTADSPLDVRVFSNCEEVALYLNGTPVGRRCPDVSRTSTRLRHPPFTFKLPRFEPGVLRAVGYVGGREAARAERRTPGPAVSLTLRFDLAGRPFAAGGKDDVFCYAEVRDAAGTVVPTASVPVFFGVTGPVKVVGDNPILSEAGTASILVQSDVAAPHSCVYALCLVREGTETRVLSAALCPDHSKAPGYEVRYTADGSTPDFNSPLYCQPLRSSALLRAAIVVDDQVVAGADGRASAPSTGDHAVLAARAGAP
jgi:beta-galactosidase